MNRRLNLRLVRNPEVLELPGADELVMQLQALFPSVRMLGCQMARSILVGDINHPDVRRRRSPLKTCTITRVHADSGSTATINMNDSSSGTCIACFSSFGPERALRQRLQGVPRAVRSKDFEGAERRLVSQR